MGPDYLRFCDEEDLKFDVDVGEISLALLRVGALAVAVAFGASFRLTAQIYQSYVMVIISSD